MDKISELNVNSMIVFSEYFVFQNILIFIVSQVNNII